VGQPGLSTIRTVRIAGMATLALVVPLIAGLVPIAALPNVAVACSTDSPEYSPGDSVHISARVASPTGQPLAATTVWMAVTNPSGAYVENTYGLSISNGTFLDTFALQANATIGNYTLFVTASRPGLQTGTCQSEFSVTNPAADFMISVDPGTITIADGESANYTVFVSSINGFEAPITLSVTQSPQGNKAAFNPSTLYAGEASTLTIFTNPTTVLGLYLLTITGSGGTKSHTAEANLTVALPFDFSDSVTPPVKSIVQGTTATYLVNVTMWGLGVGSEITLNLLGGAPFSNYLFSPMSGTSNFTSTLTIVTSASTTPGGPYPLTIIASGAGITRSASTSLTVQATSAAPAFNFDMSISPSATTIAQGMIANYSIAVIAAGPTQTVTLEVLNPIPGATTEFHNPSGKPAFTSVLQVKTTAQTNASAYPVTIVASAGTITHTQNITLFVTAPDFTLTVTPSILKVNPSGSSAAIVQVNPVGDYTQPVSLNLSPTVGSIMATIQPNMETGIFEATLNVRVNASISVGNYQLPINGVGGDGKKHTLVYELYVPLEQVTNFGGIEILSNSTITAFTVTQGALSFQAAGEQGKPGFSNVTVPVGLLGGQPIVAIDGQIIQPISLAQNQTHYVIYITYTYSGAGQIRITGSSPGSNPGFSQVPEFGDMWPLVSAVAVASWVLRRRRRVRH